MDVRWSQVLELEYLWYREVELFTISRDAEHNNESYQR